jgi:ABC-type multidrug transport system ATPase subunit
VVRLGDVHTGVDHLSAPLSAAGRRAPARVTRDPGKTTLLNLIYGTLRPRCGKALINQEAILSYRDIFYLDSRFALNEDMSVADNIEFRIDLLGGDASGAAAQLELFSLRGYENAPVKSLSTGLRQRANLAAGFSVGPSLALLDEPTNAVDPETRLLLEDLLRGRGLNHVLCPCGDP